MPEYAPELVSYLQALGGDKPSEALDNPDFLRRTLSADSPFALVAIVAQAIEGTIGEEKLDDKHPAIADLSAFEKGRIMSALGNKERARALYSEALAQIANGEGDSRQRGVILQNLANETNCPGVRFALLREAVQSEGFKEALGSIGAFLYYNLGKKEKGLEFLLQGTREGEKSCVEVLSRVLTNLFGENLMMELSKAMISGNSESIEDVIAREEKRSGKALANGVANLLITTFSALEEGGFKGVNSAFANASLQVAQRGQDGRIINAASLRSLKMAQFGDLAVD